MAIDILNQAVNAPNSKSINDRNSSQSRNQKSKTNCNTSLPSVNSGNLQQTAKYNGKFKMSQFDFNIMGPTPQI